MLPVTEKRNSSSQQIDSMSTREILTLINNEDKKVADAVEKCLPDITVAVDMIADHVQKGGRLLYFGAGTSGRLGVLDASECVPTFGVSPDKIIGTIAGGDRALRTSVENAEDSADLGVSDLLKLNPDPNDIVVGISAGGNARYVLAVLEHARKQSISTIGISSNPDAALKSVSDVFINPIVGAEILTGSSRMKSGTAQKMILNMLSTATMIKIGKTYENLMIDVGIMNEKLYARACRIICDITHVSESDAKQALAAAQSALNDQTRGVPVAVVMCAKKCSAETALTLLSENDNRVSRVLSR